MQGLIHWYNVNRKVIWAVIGILLAVYIGLQLISNIVNQNNREKIARMSVPTVTNTTDKYNTVELQEEKSIISGSNLTNNQKNSISVIDKFMEYCNNGDTSNAYNLLSTDCKEQLYPNINVFKETYFDKIFGNSKKHVVIENWVNNIYKVKFEQDALSLGKYENTGVIQDYITIVTDEQKEYKLNINSYIGKDEINRTYEVQNIKIKVNQRHKYMDYEIYSFEVTNKYDGELILADKNVLSPIYIEDDSKIQYAAYMHELSNSQLTFMAGETKNINIKFYNRYTSSKRIDKIYFSNIIVDYGSYRDSKQIQIDI